MVGADAAALHVLRFTPLSVDFITASAKHGQLRSKREGLVPRKNDEQHACRGCVTRGLLPELDVPIPSISFGTRAA